MWKKYDYRELGIIAEPYFDLDFSKVLYLTDTGRRWDGEGVSIRDKIPVRERGPEGSGLRKARRKGESEGMMERGREWERGIDLEMWVESKILRFNDSTIQRFNDSTIQRFNDFASRFFASLRITIQCPGGVKKDLVDMESSP